MRTSRWANVAVFPLVFILSIPPLVWFGENWRITPDSGWYLLQASNLILGSGFTGLADIPQTERGPVFPVLLSLLMLIFGRDVESLAWAVRLLAVANPLLVYFLIRRISGPMAGLLAAALVTWFGYSATLNNSFNLDAVALTVYLLALLLLLTSAKKDSAALSLLSGMLLGASILTKETLLASLPLALLAALLLGWSSRGVLLHYAGLILECLPWWAWVWAASGEVYLAGRVPTGLAILGAGAVLVSALVLLGLELRYDLLARLLASPHGRRQASWIVVVAWVPSLAGLLLATSTGLSDLTFLRVETYITKVLVPATPLLPFLLFAGGYVVWKAVRGCPMWRFYLVLLVLQTPVSLLALVERYGQRQFLIPQTLLLGALAVFVVAVFNAPLREGRLRFGRRLRAAVAFPLAIVLLLLATLQVQHLLSESPADAADYSSDHVRLSVRDTSDWIAQNVPEEANILTTFWHSNLLAFLDNGRHDWTLLEMDCEPGQRAIQVAGCKPSEAITETPPRQTAWFRIERGCGAVALSMPTLLRQMYEANASYLLLNSDPKYPGILESGSYLVESGAFEVVHSVREDRVDKEGVARGFTLLKRTGQRPKPAPTMMEIRTLLRLVNCAEEKEAAGGNRYVKEIRSSFPAGIELEPRSVASREKGNEPQRNIRAAELLEKINKNRNIER